jgi:hypothetical protein
MAISGAISGGSVQPLADSTGAIARQGFPAGGNTMYFGGDSFYYHPPEGTPGYDGKGWEFKDDELLSKVKEKEKPKSPPPTVPDPHPPELIHDKNDAIAVSTSPDVCRAPVNPVPFPVYGVGGDDTNYTSTVRSNGLIIKKWDSKFSKTNGDGPGTGLGLMSGTVGDVVEPTSHSPIVRVQGQPIIRHRDTCTLNKGNCPGEYIHAKSTDVHKAPDGKDEQDKKKSGWQSFKDQLYDKSGTVQTADGVIGKAGEYWNDPSKIKGDASSAWNAIPSWQSVKDFGSNVGSGLYNAGEQVVNDPLGTGGKVYDWGSGKVSDGWQGAKDAWNTDGAAGVLGAGVGAGIDLINPAKKAKMLGNIAEGAGELGEAAAKKALKDKAEKEAREKAAREAAERKASEDGKPGARSTRKLSLRDQYLGNTPGKNSKTGRDVRERMRKEGTLKTDPRTGKDIFKGEDGKWRPVDSPQTHMGHHPIDAVDYWNNTGRNLGAKSPEVRKWMLDSNNYRFEYGPLNSSRGGSTPSRYLPPTN